MEAPPHPGQRLGHGPPGAPGAFIRGHWAGVLAAMTAMVLVGMFLPLLGWSLLAFLLLDTVIGKARRRRRSPEPEAAPTEDRKEALTR